MLDADVIQKLDQVVATYVEIATTTHYALYGGYIDKGFSEEQAYGLVCDYAIHHNNGLKDIAVLVNDKEEPAAVSIEECEDDDEELDEDEY